MKDLSLDKWIRLEEKEARKKDLARFMGRIYRFGQLKALEKRYRNVRVVPYGPYDDEEVPWDELVYVKSICRPVKYLYYIEYIPLGTKDREEAEAIVEEEGWQG